jgi:hypothetical protein
MKTQFKLDEKELMDVDTTLKITMRLGDWKILYDRIKLINRIDYPVLTFLNHLYACIEQYSQEMTNAYELFGNAEKEVIK